MSYLLSIFLNLLSVFFLVLQKCLVCGSILSCLDVQVASLAVLKNKLFWLFLWVKEGRNSDRKPAQKVPCFNCMGFGFKPVA